MSIVYLAGTIAADKRFIEWRTSAVLYLERRNIIAISPIRDKNPEDWTSDGTNAPNTVYADGGYVYRDLHNIRQSDIILLNMTHLPPDGRQSIGSWFEFGYAIAHNIPVVVVASDPKIRQYGFVATQACRVFDNLDDALEYITYFLH